MISTNVNLRMELLSERYKMWICYNTERKLAVHAFKILSPYSCYILQRWRTFVGAKVIRWKSVKKHHNKKSWHIRGMKIYVTYLEEN